MNGARGYTLVEVVGGFGIAAAVALIGVPALNATVETARLKSAAWQVTTDLNVLRGKAVADRTGRELELESAANEPCRYVLRLSGSEEGETKTVGGGIRCELSPGPTVRFDARGLAPLPGTLLLRNGRNETVEVWLRATGRTEIVR